MSSQITSFPGDSVIKPAKAQGTGDVSWIPGSGRYPGEGNGNSLQYFCLENTIGRETRWATVHGVTKSWTQLSN